MRIGDLAATAGIAPHTLRFYERSGLLPPPDRTSGGYRDYHEGAVTRLDFIRRGRAAGLGLAQIRDVLRIRDAGATPCGHVEQLLEQRLDDLDRQLADLYALRGTVAGLRDAIAHSDPHTCRPEDVCRFL